MNKKTPNYSSTSNVLFTVNAAMAGWKDHQKDTLTSGSDQDLQIIFC